MTHEVSQARDNVRISALGNRRNLVKMKKLKPTTPAQRGVILGAQVTDNGERLWAGRSEKTLTSRIRKTGGRNNQGRITARHRGGGARRLYREIDFKRDKLNEDATVLRIEKDPNRTVYIALVEYVSGEKRYILCPKEIMTGDVVESSDNAIDVRPGNAMPLVHIPVGTAVHNVEMKIHKGGQIARSAGSVAHIAAKEGEYVQIKMPSGDVHLVHEKCKATIGSLGNVNHNNQRLGKAGRSRWMGKRPHVRGVAMNPIDHPHGGGEGKTSGGRHPVSPWGQLAKGKKTRNNKRTDRYIFSKKGRRA